MTSTSPGRAWQQPDPTFWQGKRVLLTGHTGFKGSWLALWLCELGAHVSGFALAPDTEPSLFDQLGLAGRLDHHVGHLRDLAALSALVAATQPEVVLHLAAQPLVRRSYAEPVLTWQTNVLGTIHLIEALRPLAHPCAAVLITTDKVYRNNEWLYGYRENDPLGGHDPYSSSKAAAELAISSWRASYCGTLPHQSPQLRLASARAGNVIGGGDWSADRLIPDAIRAWGTDQPLAIRRPQATRPWQHVLEPLAAYLRQAEQLWHQPTLAGAYNFGPHTHEAATVRHVIELAQSAYGSGTVHWGDGTDGPHEAGWLALEIAKARTQLGVNPRWTLAQTVERTLRWYRRLAAGDPARDLCEADIAALIATA